MISVVLPSSGRTDMCIEATKSLYRMASDPENIEVIVRYDDQDLESLSRVEELPDYPTMRFMVGSRHHGYVSLHDMVNEGCLRARGDYISSWNDDCLILTKDWDKIVEAGAKPDEFCIMHIATGTQFNFLTRRVYQTLGHYSLDTAYDDYIAYVGNICGINKHLPIYIDHEYHKGDRVGDDNDEKSLYIRSKFHSKGVKTLIQFDASRILTEMQDGIKANAKKAKKAGTNTNAKDKKRKKKIKNSKKRNRKGK